MSSDDAPAPRPSLLALAQDHVGLVVTMVPIMLSLIRVFAVARGDRATLVTLLSTLDVKAILLGTFAWVFPTAVGVMAAILWIRWVQQWSLSRKSDAAGRAANLWPALLTATAALVLFALGPVNDLANLFICVAAVIFLRKPERNRLGRALLIGAGFLVFVLGPVVFRAANMWLPAERLVVREQPTFVGYVLAANSLDITVLDAATSTVQRLRPEDVESRTICRLNPGLESTSLAGLLTGSARPSTPTCEVRVSRSHVHGGSLRPAGVRAPRVSNPRPGTFHADW